MSFKSSSFFFLVYRFLLYSFPSIFCPLKNTGDLHLEFPTVQILLIVYLWCSSTTSVLCASCKLASAFRSLICFIFSTFGKTRGGVILFHKQAHDAWVSLIMISANVNGQHLYPSIHWGLLRIDILFLSFSSARKYFYFYYITVSQTYLMIRIIEFSEKNRNLDNHNCFLISNSSNSCN